MLIGEVLWRLLSKNQRCIRILQKCLGYVVALIKWYKLGFSVEDIMREFPQLHPSQVYDAFSYYYDHQEEIEHDIRENEDEDSFRKMTA